LSHVRYPALCGLKPDIASFPKSANNRQAEAMMLVDDGTLVLKLEQ
jgi:hypothetical protein